MESERGTPSRLRRRILSGSKGRRASSSARRRGVAGRALRRQRQERQRRKRLPGICLIKIAGPSPCLVPGWERGRVGKGLKSLISENLTANSPCRQAIARRAKSSGSAENGSNMNPRAGGIPAEDVIVGSFSPVSAVNRRRAKQNEEVEPERSQGTR
jgi:hypothetical protein